MLSMGPPLTSESSLTGTDYVPSSPESHSLMLAPGATGSSRLWMSSAPDVGAAAEGEGSATPASLEEKDSLHPSSLIREAVTAIPDLPPQLPSPPPIIDVTVAGHSHVSLRRSLDIEYTGDHASPLE